MVRVLFFGMLRDVTGFAEDRLELPDGTSLGQVFDLYATRFPRLAALRPSIVLAANQEFASGERVLAQDDEVAFLPPVSGGSGPWTREIETSEGHFFALTREVIDTRALSARLLQGKDGAVATFEGVVRNNSQGRATSYLDYECYEAMAIRMMERIGREIAASHAISRIGIIHRLGRLQIGEASVVIVVTSPHRKPSFDAALEGINRLKRLVPIWKKEYFADGEVWVDGEWDSSVLPQS